MVTHRSQAHGVCVQQAPEVFDLDDDADTVLLLQERPAAELRSKVERAVRMCPTGALSVQD